MSNNFIETQIISSVLWICLNRIEKANAMTVLMMNKVNQYIQDGLLNSKINSIVLTGAGDRFFSAGVDITEIPLNGDISQQRTLRSLASATIQDAVLNSPKPVIVALNGSAYGAGAMFALISDACIAVEESSICFSEIDIGISTYLGANILNEIGGRSLAIDLINSGRKMSSTEAFLKCLITKTVKKNELKEVTLEYANILGSKPSHVFAENKKWINRRLIKAIAEARIQHENLRNQNLKDK